MAKSSIPQVSCWHDDRWLYVWAAVSFASSELVSHWLQIRFAVRPLGQMYQYLDPELLSHDLLRSIWNLHAQPPAFNAFLGSGLKLFPVHHALFFEIVFGLLALGLLIGVVATMRRLGVSRPLAAVSLGVFAVTPHFMVYRDWLFYTLPVAALLVWIGLCLDARAVSTPGRQWAFAIFGTTLMMTRAVYHPIWWVLVCAVTSLAPTQSWRRLRWMALGPILLMTALFVKNLYLVDNLGASSWLGMNMTKRWPLSQQEMRELKQRGAIPEFWGRRPFMEPRAFRLYGYFDEQASGSLHASLGASYKQNGEPNFNHRDYAAIARRMWDADLYLIRNYPDRYLRRVTTSVLLFLQPGPNSVDFLVEYDFSRVAALRRRLNGFFLARDIERPIRMLAPSLNLAIPLFFVLLLWGAHQSIRGPTSHRTTYRFMFVSIVWVFVVTNLIEIGENDRMRWEVEPFLWVLMTTAIQSMVSLFRVRSTGPS